MAAAVTDAQAVTAGRVGLASAFASIEVYGRGTPRTAALAPGDPAAGDVSHIRLSSSHA